MSEHGDLTVGDVWDGHVVRFPRRLIRIPRYSSRGCAANGGMGCALRRWCPRPLDGFNDDVVFLKYQGVLVYLQLLLVVCIGVVKQA